MSGPNGQGSLVDPHGSRRICDACNYECHYRPPLNSIPPLPNYPQLSHDPNGSI